MGRPTSHTPELADEICERIASGETLRAICRDDHMPTYRSVYRWRESDQEFSTRFALAREVGGDVIAEETIEIADDASNDTRITERGEQPDTEWIARSKLRVETRLKLLAVWFPRRYGQRVDVTTNNESLNLSPEERAAKLQALAALAARRRQQEDDCDLA